MTESKQVDQRDATQTLLDMLPLAMAHVGIALTKAPMSPDDVADWLRSTAGSFEKADLAEPFFARAVATALREFADSFEAGQRAGRPPELTVLPGGKTDG